MRYGNCLTGAIALMFLKRTFKIKMLFRSKIDIPHFYVTDKKGRKWHYEVVEDIFPFPFGLLLYKGKFEPIK